MDSDRDMFVVDDTVYTGDTILDNKQQQSDLIQNWCVSTTRKKERKSYLFHPRKLDMEMFPDSLEGGVSNELFVVVTVDESQSLLQ